MAKESMYVKNKVRQVKLWASLIATIIIAITWWLWHPAISVSSSTFWWFMLVIGVEASICAAVSMNVKSGLYHEIPMKEKWLSFSIWSFTALVVVILLVGGIVGSPMFYAKAYRNVIVVEHEPQTLALGTTEKAKAETESLERFQLDFPGVGTNGIPAMDEETAKKTGNRVLGAVPRATLYEVSDSYTQIAYLGKSYRVAPLEYGGLVKFLKSDGIPGYVLVDCETNEAQFYETAQRIKYSPSGYFVKDLSRHLRGQYPTLVFERSIFEIDELGNPYWVTAVTKPTAFIWSCRKVTGVVVTNAQNGESQLYGLDEVPSWVDNVYGIEYLMAKAEEHFAWVKGWPNFSNEDVLRTSYYYKGRSTSSSSSKDGETHKEPYFYGYTSFVKDGEVWVYTGVTPANKVESNTGFMTVNTRNGQYTMYAIDGAEESSAQTKAEGGDIQHMGYESTFPFMINVNGKPTFYLFLKDKSGLIQMVALVNYENRNKSAVGHTFEEALKSYLTEFGESQNDVSVEALECQSVEGVVSAKYEANIDGTTYFYYQIGEYLYKASIKVNETQVLLKAGDNVLVTYTDGDIRQVSRIEKK